MTKTGPLLKLEIVEEDINALILIIDKAYKENEICITFGSESSYEWPSFYFMKGSDSHAELIEKLKQLTNKLESLI